MIGDILRQLRTQKGETQKQTAENLGINPYTYPAYEMETREPNLKTLAALADYFGVTVDFLLGRERLPETSESYRQLQEALRSALEALEKTMLSFFSEGEHMIGDTLRQLRTQRGETQKQTAENLGIAQRAYASYELEEREPNLKTLAALADYFGVTVDFLLGRERLPETSEPRRQLQEDLRDALEALEKTMLSIFRKEGTVSQHTGNAARENTAP